MVVGPERDEIAGQAERGEARVAARPGPHRRERVPSPSAGTQDHRGSKFRNLIGPSAERGQRRQCRGEKKSAASRPAARAPVWNTTQRRRAKAGSSHSDVSASTRPAAPRPSQAPGRRAPAAPPRQTWPGCAIASSTARNAPARRHRVGEARKVGMQSCPHRLQGEELDARRCGPRGDAARRSTCRAASGSISGASAPRGDRVLQQRVSRAAVRRAGDLGPRRSRDRSVPPRHATCTASRSSRRG